MANRTIAQNKLDASCERMRETLRAAEALAANALAHQPEQVGDCWRHLSAAVGKLRAMMRPTRGTFPWHTEIGYYLQHEPNLRWLAEKDGDFYTPKAVMDVVTANPPFGKAPSAEEAVATLRSISFATKVHDAMSLQEVYDLLCAEAAQIGQALEKLKLTPPESGLANGHGESSNYKMKEKKETK